MREGYNGGLEGFMYSRHGPVSDFKVHRLKNSVLKPLMFSDIPFLLYELPLYLNMEGN